MAELGNASDHYRKLTMEGIQVVVAGPGEFTAAQCFYGSRGYGGSAIAPADFVVLAKRRGEIVGVGRLCLERELLWLRGMQVQPAFQRSGVGSRILAALSREIGTRSCYCLPYSHLVGFYRQADFELATINLPAAVASRRESYLSRNLNVVAMVRGSSPPGDSSVR